MKYDILQIDLIVSISRILEREHGIKHVRPRQLNAIIEAANIIVKEFGREPVMAVPGMGLKAWLDSDDTGSSSLFMAFWLCDAPQCDHAFPHDAVDFGRCHRFIQAMRGLDAIDAADMSGADDPWPKLAAAWPELTALYEEELAGEEFPKLNARLREFE
jgi:hypothetical protein